MSRTLKGEAESPTCKPDLSSSAAKATPAAAIKRAAEDVARHLIVSSFSKRDHRPRKRRADSNPISDSASRPECGSAAGPSAPDERGRPTVVAELLRK